MENWKDEGNTRLQVITTMKIQVVVFWVVTSCTDVVGYHGPQKRWYPTPVHGITMQKTAT
jgi:hypothetical protein